jgi:hypothetical protein
MKSFQRDKKIIVLKRLQVIVIAYHDFLFKPTTIAQYLHECTFSRALFADNHHDVGQMDQTRIYDWSNIFDSDRFHKTEGKFI